MRFGQGKTGTIQFGLQIQGDQQVEATIRWEQDDEAARTLEQQIDWDSIRTLTWRTGDRIQSAALLQIRLAEPLPEGHPTYSPRSRV